MKFAPGKPKTGGRRAGQRNRRTIEAAIAKTDALKYLSDLIDSEDETIGRDLKVKAAICLAGYQRARPADADRDVPESGDGLLPRHRRRRPAKRC